MRKFQMITMMAVVLAACSIPDDGEVEGPPPDLGGDDCAEFCEGPDKDPAMCKTCQQGPKDGFVPDPLPWRIGWGRSTDQP